MTRKLNIFSLIRKIIENSRVTLAKFNKLNKLSLFIQNSRSQVSPVRCFSLYSVTPISNMFVHLNVYLACLRRLAIRLIIVTALKTVKKLVRRMRNPVPFRFQSKPFLGS
jgi:hypothetical protein